MTPTCPDCQIPMLKEETPSGTIYVCPECDNYVLGDKTPKGDK